jgi:hypothetical protein
LNEQFSGGKLSLTSGFANVGYALNEGDWFVLDDMVSITNVSSKRIDTYPMLENFIESANNSSPVPPIRRIDGLSTNTTARPTSTLDLDHRPETTCRECFLEL